MKAIYLYTSMGLLFLTRPAIQNVGNCQRRKNVELLFKHKNSHNIIGAVGQNGFACFKICIGRVNQFVFGQFMTDLINKAMSFIKIRNLQQLWIKVHSSHLFLPPYSPELNPIEGIWNMLKQQVYKKQPINEFNLQQEIHIFQKGISKLTIDDFIKNA